MKQGVYSSMRDSIRQSWTIKKLEKNIETQVDLEKKKQTDEDSFESGFWIIAFFRLS